MNKRVTRGDPQPGCCPSGSDPSERFLHPSPRSSGTPTGRNADISSQRRGSGPMGASRSGRSYLGESGLFGLLQGEDSSALQQTAEGQTLALAHRRHLPPSAQTAVHLVELENTREHKRTVSQDGGESEPAQEGAPHLPQDHFLGLPAAYQQQQAADQQLLLEGETLRVTAVRRHAVAVNL